MRRLAAAAMVCLLVLAGLAFAESPGLSIDAPGEIRPGSPVTVSFTVPEDGTCTIGLADETGDASLTISAERSVTAGYNAMYWNGTWQGVPAPEGRWRLVLEMNGDTAETPLTIGRMLPFLVSSELSSTQIFRFSSYAYVSQIGSSLKEIPRNSFGSNTRLCSSSMVEPLPATMFSIWLSSSSASFSPIV